MVLLPDLRHQSWLGHFLLWIYDVNLVSIFHLFSLGAG